MPLLYAKENHPNDDCCNPLDLTNHTQNIFFLESSGEVETSFLIQEQLLLRILLFLVKLLHILLDF